MNFHLLVRSTIGLLASLVLSVTLLAQGNPGYVARNDGAWIHYLEVGESNSSEVNFLFVPGWMMPAWIWAPQLDSLKDEYRAVAMSPRSQGRSSKESDGLYPKALAADIKAVIDQLQLRPVILVAWSMGVAEAAAFVDSFGTADLAGLVLVDGLAGVDDPGSVLSGPIKESLVALQEDRAEATRRFVASMFRSRRTADYLDRLTGAALSTPTNSALALYLGSLTFDQRPALSKIDIPTLIVAARGPQRPDWSRFQQMQGAIPGSRLEVFPEAGHALFVDEPGRFNQLLRDFAKK